jgi:hypothetical protein
MSKVMRAGLLALLSLLPLGCAATDPFLREGVWNPTGANAANLATMVADPLDLARGRNDATVDGRLAGAAVTRLRHDRVKPLPASDTMSSGSSGGGSAPAGAPAGAPGNGE